MNSSKAAEQHVKLAFIGGGQMATALAVGLVAAGWPREDVVVVEPNEAQRAKLADSAGLSVMAAPGPQLAQADIVVWAVKPQVLEQAMHQAVPFLSAPLHVSIAAGVRSDAISLWAASRRVVRVMPNTAALVGAGVSGITALDGIEQADRELVDRIMAPTGHCFWVDSDDRLDAVTAVSGSGPAYVFHFMEAFQAAAEKVGFGSAQARELVIKTVFGAVEQAAHVATDFSVLRQNVTSKHGTTEAAIAVLDNMKTAQALEAAVLAACQRSGELSAQFGKQNLPPR